MLETLLLSALFSVYLQATAFLPFTLSAFFESRTLPPGWRSATVHLEFSAEVPSKRRRMWEGGGERKRSEREGKVIVWKDVYLEL